MIIEYTKAHSSKVFRIEGCSLFWVKHMLDILLSSEQTLSVTISTEGVE